MNQNVLKKVLGVDDIPDEIPPALVLAIGVNGYSEEETRSIISENEDVQTTERWIQAFTKANCFRSRSMTSDHDDDDDDTDRNLNDEERYDNDKDIDDGCFLWRRLKKELESNENDFKHRVFALDTVTKSLPTDLFNIGNLQAKEVVPFDRIRDNCPWNGCKFASNTVLLFVSSPNADSKRDALRPVSRSLGGCTIPSQKELDATRWPYVLKQTYDQAVLDVETKQKSTALHISLNDVEIMRNPGKGLQGRPGTFAHNCVMTVSPKGVYLYQSYGPRGYTLLQNMQHQNEIYPLSFDNGMKWVDRFQQITGELGGKWTKEVNEAYDFCFGVNLIQFGNMKLGSQLDAHVDVYAHDFDADMVRQNFSLLPLRDPEQSIPCTDGVKAKLLGTPDGGVPHYYHPTILSCGYCGAGGGGNAVKSVCTKCKRVRYCSKPCQVQDWQLRHKIACKRLAEKIEK